MIYRSVSTGRWLLIALLVLNRGSADAEWKEVERSDVVPGLQTVYVDPETVQREGSLVTLWQLTDYKWRQGDMIGSRRFLSTKTRKQFDCAEKRVRLLAFTDFLGHMGTGTPADGYVSHAWFSVQPESLDQALWELACGKERSF